jgi:hypothetical protein
MTDGRIYMHENDGLRYWGQHYGVTPGTLRAAIEVAGPVSKNVAKHLGKA